MKKESIVDEFEGKETIVSHSGTRHMVSDGSIGSQRHGGRVTTQCGMGLKPDIEGTPPREAVPGDLGRGPFLATGDCQFCRAQARYAPAIRQMFADLAQSQAPRPFVSVKDAAKSCGTTTKEICNAVAGAPDLFWDHWGTMIRRLNATTPRP